MIRRPPSSTLLPYAPLFRSQFGIGDGEARGMPADRALAFAPLRLAEGEADRPGDQPEPAGTILICARVSPPASLGCHGPSELGSEEHTPELQSPCNLQCRLL